MSHAARCELIFGVPLEARVGLSAASPANPTMPTRFGLSATIPHARSEPWFIGFAGLAWFKMPNTPTILTILQSNESWSTLECFRKYTYIHFMEPTYPPTSVGMWALCLTSIEEGETELAVWCVWLYELALRKSSQDSGDENLSTSYNPKPNPLCRCKKLHRAGLISYGSNLNLYGGYSLTLATSW